MSSFLLPGMCVPLDTTLLYIQFDLSTRNPAYRTESTQDASPDRTGKRLGKLIAAREVLGGRKASAESSLP